MNIRPIPGIAMALCGLLAMPPAQAESKLLLYKPPQVGAPLSRVGGGTRGLAADAPILQVLAPDHTALTGKAQPVLYWHISQASTQPVEITITHESDADPILDKQLAAIARPGLQAIKLADYGVTLAAGEEYRWSVALISDAEQRSGDQVASATIRYEKPAAPLSSTEALAGSGYWYDALDKLVQDKSPQIGALLEQVGLHIPDL